MALCPGQRFAVQPVVLPACSGTLIGPDLFATAGHCIAGPGGLGGSKSAASCRPGQLEGWSVVFDYTSDSNGVYPENNVYEAIEVVHCVDDSTYCDGLNVDWAVVRLERQVVGRVPVALQRTVVQVGTPVYVVGHPSGLPRKYTLAGDAEVIRVYSGPANHSNVYMFHNNLDSFGGNSGSGIFNSETNEMVGIIMRGAGDYVRTPAGCRVVKNCPQDAASGCVPNEACSSTVLLPFLLDMAGCTADADCNAGTCASGICECDHDYHGPDCSFKCDRGYCNGRGTCIGYDQCECDNQQPWPPLCSVAKWACKGHTDCVSGGYCAMGMCRECSDCAGRTCEDRGDSFDGITPTN